jgi:hypothetical protein|mmetsp:Transcript_41224/g.69304  ORF Transcript_41224/g.69304 Transcript_41224/m.69304 type:complete len:210 (+) Transcript_41224:185-814(+)
MATVSSTGRQTPNCGAGVWQNSSSRKHDVEHKQYAGRWQRPCTSFLDSAILCANEDQVVLFSFQKNLWIRKSNTVFQFHVHVSEMKPRTWSVKLTIVDRSAKKTEETCLLLRGCSLFRSTNRNPLKLRDCMQLTAPQSVFLLSEYQKPLAIRLPVGCRTPTTVPRAGGRNLRHCVWACVILHVCSGQCMRFSSEREILNATQPSKLAFL